ncbi:MAG: hypothetical protein ACI4U2_04855 [Christensenellaceae bacterium]
MKRFLKYCLLFIVFLSISLGGYALFLWLSGAPMTELLSLFTRAISYGDREWLAFGLFGAALLWMGGAYVLPERSGMWNLASVGEFLLSLVLATFLFGMGLPAWAVLALCIATGAIFGLVVALVSVYTPVREWATGLFIAACGIALYLMLRLLLPTFAETEVAAGEWEILIPVGLAVPAAVAAFIVCTAKKKKTHFRFGETFVSPAFAVTSMTLAGAMAGFAAYAFFVLFGTGASYTLAAFFAFGGFTVGVLSGGNALAALFVSAVLVWIYDGFAVVGSASSAFWCEIGFVSIAFLFALVVFIVTQCRKKKAPAAIAPAEEIAVEEALAEPVEPVPVYEETSELPDYVPTVEDETVPKAPVRSEEELPEQSAAPIASVLSGLTPEEDDGPDDDEGGELITISSILSGKK